MSNKNQFLYLALLLLVTFFWGLTFPIIKTAISFISPVLFLSFRFLVSAALLLPFLRNRNAFSRTNMKYGIIAGSLLFIGYYFQTVGLEFTAAAKSGIITGTYVVLIPVISYFYLKKRIRRMDSIASFMAFVGLIIMSAGNVSNPQMQLGDILTLICAFGYAFQVAYVSKHSKNLDSTVFTFYQILMVGVLSTIALPTYPLGHQVFNYYVVFAILFTAAFAGVIGYYINTKALVFVEPTTAGIIFVGEPIFAAVTSVIINKEVLGILGIIGGGVMVLAMFMTTFDKYLANRRVKKAIPQ